LFFQRQGFVFAVIGVAGHLMDALPQRTAEGDIHFLKSAANRQQRYAGGDGSGDQRKRRSITSWVMQCSRQARRSSIVLWLNIRRTSRQQQPIAGIEHRSQILFAPEGGNEDRNRVRALRDGFDVLLANQMEMVLSNETAIGRNSYERLAKHVEYFKRPIT